MASKRSTRLRPRSLARYMAASASCTRLSPLMPSRSAMAMPMLALTYVSPSLRGTASATTRRIRSAWARISASLGASTMQHGELVAAEAGDRVDGPHACAGGDGR